MPRVFISHSSADRDIIERDLIPVIRSHGIDIWYSSNDIPSASDWEKEIRHALNECDWFLVALSLSSMKSDWVQAEVHWALDHRKDHFISLLLDSCTPSDLHLKLIRYQHVDWRSVNDTSRRKLINAFGVPYHDNQAVEIEFLVSCGSTEQKSFIINECAIIGRTNDADIVVPDVSISRRHAMIKVRQSSEGMSLWIADLQSANGLFVNGIMVREPVRLHEGDRIQLGDAEMKLIGFSRCGNGP